MNTNNLPNNPPLTPPESAPVAPQENFTLDETKQGLADLKKELSTAEGAGDIMKRFENNHVDASEWAQNPKSAIPMLEKILPEGKSRHLIFALQQPENSAEFEAGRKTLLTIAESTGNRRKTIEEAKVALNNLSEYSLLKKIEDGAVNLYKGAMRGDITSIIVVATGLSALLWHVWRKDDNNTVLRPLFLGALGLVTADAVKLAATGKGFVDNINNMRDGGMPFVPSAQKELPEEMQRLGKKAGVEDASEFVALGRLGKYPMSHLYDAYDPSKKTIEPSMFGFSKREISGERLYKIVDTMVKRHDNRKINGVQTGKPGDFKRDFVDKHDYSFLETSYLLYEKEVNNSINLALNPEKRKEYYAKVQSDTETMFKNTPAQPEFKDDMPVFYGVKFHVATQEGADPTRPTSYTYELGDGPSLTVGVNDSHADRMKQAQQLKDMAKNFLMARLEEEDPTSEALSHNLEYNAFEKSWVFKNVMIDGELQDVFVEDNTDGLFAVVKGKTIELGKFLKEQAGAAKDFTVEKTSQVSKKVGEFAEWEKKRLISQKDTAVNAGKNLASKAKKMMGGGT